MAKKRMETWLAVIIGGIGLIPAAILGLWLYTGATAKILHPSAKEVPSATRSAPLPKWSGAIEEAGQIVRDALVEQNLPGLSVAVGSGGEIVWAEGFGWADIDRRVAVKPETQFRIGTASVALTSAAVGLLLESGRLNLDDEIQKYVPEFPKKQWPVTLRQLMGHTAGVANDGGDEGPLLSRHCDRPADALQFLSGYERELRFEPGTQFGYSSYGWVLMSAAIEAATHEPFSLFMQRQVFEPLAMDDTMSDSTTEPVRDRATFYFPRFAADPRYGLHLMREVDYSCYAGSSAFVSTPSDMVRFAMAIDEGKLLQPATVKLLRTSQRLRSGEETGYGLGWDLETVQLANQPMRWVGHDGETLGGTVASLMTFPDHGLVVSVISNISYADTPGIAVKIAQAFAGRVRGVS